MTTPLNDNLLAVPVPENSYEHILYSNNTGICYWDGNRNSYEAKELPRGKYKLLGLVTPKEIGFDCEPYVPTLFYKKEVKHRNYLEKDVLDVTKMCNNPADSFRSLLLSKGLDLDRHYLIISKI